jgi:hypothetical protein
MKFGASADRDCFFNGRKKALKAQKVLTADKR